MEAKISTSEIVFSADNYTEKAWYLISVLLSIGRPVTPAELAGKCSRFRPTPEFIEFLCLIPNSPLFMTLNGIVLISASAFRAVGEFFAVSIPEIQISDVWRNNFSDVWRNNFMSGIVPLVKNSAIFESIEGNMVEKERFGDIFSVSMPKVKISDVWSKTIGSAILRSNEGSELEQEKYDSSDRTVLALKALPLDIPREVAVTPVRTFNDMVVTRSMANSKNGVHRRCDKVVVKYFRKRKKVGGDVVPLAKKRAVLRLTAGNEREEDIGSNCRIVLSLNALPVDMPRGVALGNLCDEAVTPSTVNYNIRLLEHQSMNNEDEGSEVKLKECQAENTQHYVEMERHQEECYNNNGATLEMPEAQEEGCRALLSENLAKISASQGVDELDPVDLMAKIDTSASSLINLDQHNKNTSANGATTFHSHKDFINIKVPGTRVDDMVEMFLNDNAFPERTAEKKELSLGSCGVGSFFEDLFCHTSMDAGKHSSFRGDVANNNASKRSLILTKPQCSSQKTFSKISAVQKKVPKQTPTLKQKALPESQHDNKVDIFRKERKDPNDQNTGAFRDNGKHIARNSAGAQVNCVNKSLKEQQKSKYPEFESYIVEEEEGSGGYGTVYRARRKTDGVKFAIKCPHANARIHHLKNELKMLQRFGGKNFVIKYEASLKSRNADCFVLEHVEHDRPEALKMGINIDQLQWYGFCLFKALSSLHKQGVFHRDIKPGNFLFSCKTKRGYLIDFNLAKDLHQKPGSLEKSQPSYTTATEQVPRPQHTFASSNKRRKILSGKPSEAFGLKAYHNSITSQCADGSGLTSKDLTSNRTSGGRLREPVPCQGRKELINLAQEAMLTPKIGTGNVLVSKRKRVAASPVVIHSTFIHITPTPLHTSGKCFSGAGSLNNRGEVKPHKEGPCAGTKGFRAPEVLLRSLYQGPKIDVWSAGVTLLYLITGKMPFTGDPEQNMKDIVKLKGNEELWEVAKLHNRESSIPLELLDIRFLRSMAIKEWCVANTKRMTFVDTIPNSLFDLIEKCLVVNPRMRITAEEALRHEFFAPCHDVLQRMKLHKPPQNQQPRNNCTPLLLEPVGTP